jgi:hypothetical protein
MSLPSVCVRMRAFTAPSHSRVIPTTTRAVACEASHPASPSTSTRRVLLGLGLGLAVGELTAGRAWADGFVPAPLSERVPPLGISMVSKEALQVGDWCQHPSSSVLRCCQPNPNVRSFPSAWKQFSSKP